MLYFLRAPLFLYAQTYALAITEVGLCGCSCPNLLLWLQQNWLFNLEQYLFITTIAGNTYMMKQPVLDYPWIHTCRHMHARTHAHRHANTQAHRHTGTQARRRTHAHTHTRPHTYVSKPITTRSTQCKLQSGKCANSLVCTHLCWYTKTPCMLQWVVTITGSIK